METIFIRRLSLLMLLMCLHTKSGQSALITFPRDTEVLVNHSTYFNCSTSIISEQIHWYHYRVGENQTNYVYYKGQFNQVYADRYSIEINTKTGEYNLIIRSVQHGDAGRYVCQDDVGLGNSSSAELIVLDSTPTCLSNMKPDGFVGPNSCYIPLEKLQLSCSGSFNGNIPPILQWKMDGNDAPISKGITNDYSGKHATVNLTTSSTVEMHDKYFTCGTTRSQDKQLSCATDSVNNYAAGQPMTLNITKGETITCSANAYVPCTYRWFHGNETQHTVSYNQLLTTNRLGNHSCEASCPINGINCTFVALRIIVVVEEDIPKDPTKTLLIAILVSSLALLLIIACVGLLVFRKRKAKTENTELQNKNSVLPKTSLQSRGATKQSTNTVDDESNATVEPTVAVDTSVVDDEVETQSLLKAGGNSIIQTSIKQSELTTKASIEMGRAIAGVAALEDTIYVVSVKSSDIEMFDIATFEFKKRYNLIELENPWDLTSCNLNNCLYVMDIRSPTTPKFVIRVDSNVRIMVLWSTGEEYGNLSVTSEGHVIVTFCDSRRLAIYGPYGQMVNVVSLSADLIHPSHALKLSNDQFLICHGINKDNIHRLCVLNKDGEIIKSSVEMMKSPSYLAADEADMIFVVDQGNKRVIVLNSDLELVGEVASKQSGLRGPQRIFLRGNESTGKLFVVDNNVELESKRRDGKLLIFSYALSLQ